MLAGLDEAKQIRAARSRDPDRFGKLADALPGLAAAEHAAEGATLDLEHVRSLHRHRRVVVAAAVGIVDPAGPLVAVGRLHVDENALAGLIGIAAEILAALLDAH